MMQQGEASGPSTTSRASREAEDSRATSLSAGRDELPDTKSPSTLPTDAAATPSSADTTFAYQYAPVQQMTTKRDHM